MIRVPPIVVLVIAGSVVAGCQRASGGSSRAPFASTEPGGGAPAPPLGNPPGEPVIGGAQIANPLEGDAAAVAQGKRLFSAMNCVYCHGSAASGLMGPPLDARGWRYGGAPAQLYASIRDGRPRGMPAWGERLPPQSIWAIVAYLESLGGALPPATAGMANLAPPEPSATGPQAADQSRADSAEAGRRAGDAEPEPKPGPEP